MFGYIRTDTPELRVRENEYYRAVYCGLCRAQGKCTGQCSRITLNYDMAFLAIVRMAICGSVPEFDRKRCIVHPFHKRVYVKSNEELDYCARLSAILTCGKCMDDLHDEKGAKKLKARLLSVPARSICKRAKRNTDGGEIDYSQLEAEINNLLLKLSEFEMGDSCSVDEPAEIFGEVMACAASYGLCEKDARIMKNIGRHLGRWVYITDAIDDISDDRRKGSYNPFLRMYNNREPNDEEKREISDALRLELLAAEPALDLIDYGDRRDMEGIIKNVVYSGMPKCVDRILFGPEKDKNQKHKKDKKDRKDNSDA